MAESRLTLQRRCERLKKQLDEANHKLETALHKEQYFDYVYEAIWGDNHNFFHLDHLKFLQARIMISHNFADQLPDDDKAWFLRYCSLEEKYQT